MTLPRPTWSYLPCFLYRIQLPKVLLALASIVTGRSDKSGVNLLLADFTSKLCRVNLLPGLEIAPKLKPLLR